MNKAELIEAVSAEADLTKAQTSAVLDAIVNGIKRAVAAGDKVTLVGFGTFGSTARAARSGRNPKTGETMTIAASKTPKFTAGASFKEAVKAGKA